jgi:hypothetical protein
LQYIHGRSAPPPPPLPPHSQVLHAVQVGLLAHAPPSEVGRLSVHARLVDVPDGTCYGHMDDTIYFVMSGTWTVACRSPPSEESGASHTPEAPQPTTGNAAAGKHVVSDISRMTRMTDIDLCPVYIESVSCIARINCLGIFALKSLRIKKLWQGCCRVVILVCFLGKRSDVQ